MTAVSAVAAPTPSEAFQARHGVRVIGLDGIRAIAVTMVIATHYYHLYGSFGIPVIDELAANGMFGVDVFFVLSGYLITWLLLEEETRNNSFSLRGFYARRALRIQPPAIFYLLAISLLGLTGIISLGLWDVVPCIFSFRNLTTGAFATGHFWSLSIEEQFYLLWPFLLFLVRAPRRRALLIGGLLLFAPIWRQTNYIAAGGAMHVNSWRFDLRYDSLLMGCALAFIRSRVRGISIKRGAPFLSAAAPIVALGVLVLLLGGLLDHGALHFLRIMQPTVCYASVATLINYVVEHPDTFLSNPVMVWLGRISYSLYLWQQLAFVSETNSLVPLKLAGVLAAAALSFYCLEQPFNRLRRRIES